jgi:hypothetical protein
MQLYIREDRGDHTPLRSPSLWMDDLSIGRKTTRLQPLPDEPSRRPVVDAQTEHLHQLVMVQMVEKAFYIGFDYVTIPSLLQIKGQVSNRIQRSTPWAIPITAT